jgi:LacI family transcriptional regulator
VPGAHVPVLYAFARSTDPRDVCLVPDDAQGGALAARHLAGLGRRRFAHISGPADWEAVRLRREGMRAALDEHGLACPPERILHGPWSESWGYEAAIRLLEDRSGIDALFCGSDRLARGAVDALRERGIRIPGDVAVVGFDNWEIFAAATRPPLSTVDLELEALGRLAGQQLLAMIAGVPGERGTARQPCRLVVRASCGAAASAGARELWSQEAEDL